MVSHKPPSRPTSRAPLNSGVNSDNRDLPTLTVVSIRDAHEFEVNLIVNWNYRESFGTSRHMTTISLSLCSPTHAPLDIVVSYHERRSPPRNRYIYRGRLCSDESGWHREAHSLHNMRLSTALAWEWVACLGFLVWRLSSLNLNLTATRCVRAQLAVRE